MTIKTDLEILYDGIWSISHGCVIDKGLTILVIIRNHHRNKYVKIKNEYALQRKKIKL